MNQLFTNDFSQIILKFYLSYLFAVDHICLV